MIQRKQQRGAVLVISLLLLFVITTLAISGMNTATTELAMARNEQNYEFAFQAAETGHLVFATVHSAEVDDMPERVIGSFPEMEQPQIRHQLANVGLALIAQKIDVDEELDRLDTHIKEVTRLVKKGGSMGRRLDFLMQE